MVIVYILDCIRIGTKPCKYFQLNSAAFDREQGIFSKLAIDQRIPPEWRLHQQYEDGKTVPETWPVFVKPEWGQNAAGVKRADDPAQLEQIRREIADQKVRYLLQYSAPESREFEVFSLRSYIDRKSYAVLTVTEAVNEKERDPVNSVYNTDTRYVEISDQLDDAQRDTLWRYTNRVGRFNISRASLRANSIEDLLAGRFHVIEVNLFLPMPINLLDQRYSRWDIFRKVTEYMLYLARLTKVRDKTLVEKPVFTKIMMYNRKSWLINFLRARI